MKKLIAVACAAVSAAVLAETPESQGVSSRAILSWIDACEKELDAVHGFVLRRHGKVIAEGSWAPYDTLNRTHMLYSHSKSFTSTAVGFLVDEGKVDLDERVLALFPDKAPANPSENLRQLRVRDLLTMNVGAKHTDAEPSAGRHAGDERRAPATRRAQQDRQHSVVADARLLGEVVQDQEERAGDDPGGPTQASSSTENGPSFRSRTFMSAPKRPVPTRSAPSSSRSFATTRS